MKEEKFNCKKCSIEIGGHNQYCHDGMCDKCYFEEYFPEDAQIFEIDISEIRKTMKMQEKENMSFWRWLKTDEIDFERFNKIVKEVTEKIDCTKCGNCCKEMSPLLNEEDTKRIADYLKMGKEELIKKYIEKDGEGNLLFKKPCGFLENDKCKIYGARPKECREFPHLDKDVTDRCHQFFDNAGLCPIVFNVLENAKGEFEQEIYEFENPEM